MPSTAKQDMIALLARRDHSYHELTRKLLAKKHAPDVIAQAITELTEKGLFSETKFIESYIRYRRNKGYGPLRISMELQTHQIAKTVIAEHLNITDNAWFNDIRQVWQRRFKGTMPTQYSEKAKQMRFLQYRGFTPEHIESLFKQLE